MKIGRNEPCPCGSEQKYKKCCLNKQNVLQWPVFPEQFVLKDLLTSSKLFKKFYEAERPKITNQLSWAQDNSLSVGINGSSTRLSDGKLVIRLRRIPATLDDARLIAHELTHFLIDLEGFPHTGASARFANLSSTLNSMVHDPLVDFKLKERGFNIVDGFEEETKENLRQLKKKHSSPTDYLDKIHWIFNYAGYVLGREVVYQNEEKKDEFRSWFDERFPDIGKEANILLGKIKHFGFDTPEKQVMLFKGIINEYDLEKYLIFNS